MIHPAPGIAFETPSDFYKFPGTNFTPFYSPQDMIDLGVFGGTYFNKISYIPSHMKAILSEKEWQKYSQLNPVAEINATYVNAPQRRRDMDIPFNIRTLHTQGWFQWYSQYFYGIRGRADKWRIDEWTNQVKTCYEYYKRACQTAGYPVGQWNDPQPPEAVRLWIQHLLHFSWPFNKVPVL